ncbi:MAG TPA: signal peptidase II [Xanthomonadaceae bacterium]|nr:signal peptidase II [Xanthomonadaceae bacterium]
MSRVRARNAAISRSRPNAVGWLWLSALVIALDQVSKLVALALLTPQQRIPVLPGLFDWTLTYNTGAAFSFLSDAGGWQRWFFVVLAIGVSAVLVVWLARIRRDDWRQALPFALIVGGALGNVIDRLRLGKVVDFILVYWRDWYFPAFNIADSAITVGAVLIVLFSLRPAARPAAGG